MLGVLTFLDPPRPDTKYTLDMAKKVTKPTNHINNPLTNYRD